MLNHLQNYKIELEILGPVFVGSGRSYGKKETIFEAEKNKVLIPDIQKMYQWMRTNKLGVKYQEFLMSTYSDFSFWLKKNAVLRQDYMKWVEYELDASDTELDTREKKEILCFVKDAYGKPYIPGSSLKGALRTVLLSDIIQKDKYKNRVYRNKADEIKAASFKNRKSYLSREIKSIETEAFFTRELEETKRTDAVNDILGGVRISDSKPLSTDDLILCKKIDIKPDGEQHTLNILRECLKPGTKVTFDLTIDMSATTIKVEDIRSAVNTFLKIYNKSFDNKFKDGENFENDVLYIGGGCGFVSKTVLYPLLGEKSIREVSKIIDAPLPYKMKREHNHSSDVRLGASPHIIKKTMHNNQLVSFGACRLVIK